MWMFAICQGRSAHMLVAAFGGPDHQQQILQRVYMHLINSYWMGDCQDKELVLVDNYCHFLETGERTSQMAKPF